ncbi:MAG: DUF503 domain-containing protein [Limnochordia bacterium]|jgi:uncharacterized protein YlxP (DUF503 family)|nr:DUF503 domain-containing protein [Limnochordia bacterium]
MLVGTLSVQVYIPGATSLKDKRRVVKSMIAKVQNRFNVSIAELHSEDLWQRATIGVACIGDSREHIERQLQYLLNFLDAEPNWEVIQVDIELN